MQLDLSFFLPVIAASFAAALLVRFTFAAYATPRSRSSVQPSFAPPMMTAEPTTRTAQVRYSGTARRATNAL
jgi:hypothetical protein